MKRSISRSLWCVMKGLAEAPPGIMFMRGVSTSRKPRPSKNRRMYVMILALCVVKGWKIGCLLEGKFSFQEWQHPSSQLRPPRNGHYVPPTLPDNELVSDLLVHDEIQIPLPEASLFVLQAIVQVWQHMQARGQQGHLLGDYAQFPFLGLSCVWEKGNRRGWRHE